MNHVSAEDRDKWQSEGINVWLDEAMSYREQIYDILENAKLSYEYNFKNISIVNERLLKAGVRLAGILNEIYG